MYIADLHIHSKYSRATSSDCDLPHLDLWARKKGIEIIGTGDFTHPAWREHIREYLEPAETGLYTLKDAFRLPCSVAADKPRFVLSSEISCIYKQGDRVRKVHNVIVLPDLDAAETLSQKLEAIGNVRSDGRPILGLSSRDLLAIALDACADALFIPAHIWTPHFSLFGAFSGFDTIEECFGDLTKHIHALETGLSSDPPMNWRVPMLDGYTLISNSDAHSPAKLGREANLIDAPLSYAGLKHAIESGEGFAGTLEFFPEEGKYHLDGHRNCHLRLNPADTRAYNGVCPVCGKKITVGVLSRVETLSARKEGFVLPNAKPFEHIVPLPEIVGEAMELSATSTRTQKVYEHLLSELGSEFYILRQADAQDVARVAGEAVGEGIRRLRLGKVQCEGGFDGEYGRIQLFEAGEAKRLNGQFTFLQPGEGGRKQKEPLPKAVPQKNFTEAAAELSATVGTETNGAPILNDEQREAATSRAEVTSVIAGPGTGKTATLVARAAYLLTERKVPPAHITAVTFTNQAAEEMRRRLSSQPDCKNAAAKMHIGTFHALCLQILQDDGREITLITPDEAREIAEEVIALCGCKLSPTRLLQAVSARKNGAEPNRDTEEAYLAYCSRLRANNVLDFDDLIKEGLKRDYGADSRFAHLLVDEFQDINEMQYKLLCAWRASAKSLFVIGDPDQSIYGFRGAAPDCFDRLQNDSVVPKTVRLVRNYRSTPQILALAQAAIREDTKTGGGLVPCRKQGAQVRLVQADSDLSEGIFVAQEIARMTGGIDMLGAANRQGDAPVRAFSDIAVLCRTHRQAEAIEDCLRHDGIPCLVVGREDYLLDPAVRGVLAFFRHLLCPDDLHSLRVCLKTLFDCPADLMDAAANAPNGNALTCDELPDAPALTAWRNTAATFAPLLPKEKPRKLLDAFCKDRKLTGDALQKLCDTAVFYDDMSALLETLLLGEEGDICRSEKKKYAAGAVRISTLHGAKGLEFPVVFLCGLTEGKMPLTSPRYPTDLGEERRLFFVGLTRAKEELVLVAPGPLSPFVQSLPTDTYVREKATDKKRPTGKQLSMFG